MVLKRVLVTGASGMIGRQITAKLRADGIGCIATSRRRPAALPEGTEWVGFDLAERPRAGALDALFGAVDAIMHCGAFVPRTGLAADHRTMIDVNVGACHSIGAWALELGAAVVFVSGAAVYADPADVAMTEDAPTGYNDAAGLYGATKLMGEMVFADLVPAGLKTAILRPPSVYGPGLASGKMIRNFLETAAGGGTIALSPPTEERIGLVYAGDVARAALLALEKDAWGTFNIAGGAPSVREIAEAAVRVAGQGRVGLPDGTGEAEAPGRFVCDGARAKARLGYAPAFGLDDGLRATLDDILSTSAGDMQHHA